jgi:type II secretory pathway pseudopilin PulG
MIMKLKTGLRNSMTSGFTLVEIVASIVVLAIVTIPVLSYFSSSTAYNYKQKINEAANIAAQDTLESVKADKTVKLKTAADSDGFDLVAEETPAPDGSTPGYREYSKDTVIDGINLSVTARITTVDAIGTRAITDASGNMTPINFSKYSLESMDQSKDVLAAASASGSDDKHAEQYYISKYDAANNTDTVDYSSIASAVNYTKNYLIDIIPDKNSDTALNDPLVTVNVYSEYTSAGYGSYKSLISNNSVATSRVRRDGMNVYLFFPSLNANQTTDVKVNCDPDFASGTWTYGGKNFTFIDNLSNSDSKGMNIFIIGQKTDANQNFTNNKVNITTDSSSESINYMRSTLIKSLVSNCPFGTKASIAKRMDNNFKSSEDADRLINIDVTVTKKGETAKLAEVKGAASVSE